MPGRVNRATTSLARPALRALLATWASFVQGAAVRQQGRVRLVLRAATPVTSALGAPVLMQEHAVLRL